MKWVQNFQLFLFDFDGLLVNTEQLHYQAYIDMMKTQGFRLKWSFLRFCEVAHLNASALREALYSEFPELSLDWPGLYEIKKKAYYDLIACGKVDLMPGAGRLLEALDRASIRRCVATNSFLDQIEMIRSKIPSLKTIPHWVTREDYEKQKPHPDAYLKAIELCGQPGDRVVGFEDSIRGLQALQETSALPILICSSDHPLLQLAPKNAIHFDSLDSVSL